MAHTPSNFITYTLNKDPFSTFVQTTSYTDNLERQLRLDRLSQFFDSLTKKKELIARQIDELKALQEDIRKLNDKI